MFQRVSFGFWVLLGLLISVWVLSIVATGAGFNVASFEWDFTNSGAFGDSFGPISAVMASLAAAAAFETLHDSRVSARRTELREQKREREDDIRRFENTYFNLLRSFENLVEQTDIERGQERHVKRGGVSPCHT